MVIPGNLCETHRCPIDGEICGGTHSTNLMHLAHYHDHTAYIALVIRVLLYSSLSTSGVYAAFHLTISPNVDAVTRPNAVQFIHQIGHLLD